MSDDERVRGVPARLQELIDEPAVQLSDGPGQIMWREPDAPSVTVGRASDFARWIVDQFAERGWLDEYGFTKESDQAAVDFVELALLRYLEARDGKAKPAFFGKSSDGIVPP